MDCVFCRIVRGELPCYKVYEDEHCVAFLDINPVSKGHLLVVPKVHATKITELSPQQLCSLLAAVQLLAKKIEEKLTQHYNIVINQGKLAGQEIEHLHIHLIPRYGQEQIFSWKTHKLTEEEAKEVLEKLKE
ncbi:MAG: HIT family protein [bacterium]|nr:HIT family protein [bacterium]